MAEPVYTPQGFLVEGPVLRGTQYVVTITDQLSGESTEKTFTLRTRAFDWVTEQVLGVNTTRAGPVRSKVFNSASARTLNGNNRPRVGLDGRGLTAEERAETPRFNIRPVREVLEDYGLDPTAELAAVLTEREPVLDNAGQPVFEAPDPETGELVPKTKPVLSYTQRAMLLIELQQYVTPKLRAVEMKAEIKTELSEDQVDQRIATIVAAHPELAAVVAAATAGKRSAQ